MLSKKRVALLTQSMATYAAAVGAAECSTYLTRRGIDEETAWDWGLGYVAEPAQKDHEDRVGRLVLPYWTPTGLIGAKYRCIGDHAECKPFGHAKYLTEDGMGTHLYGVGQLKVPSDTIGLTEGEIDAITLTMAGIPAVAVPGSGGWRREWRHLFEDYEEVLVFLDGDEDKTHPQTGKLVEAASKKFARTLERDLPNARTVQMPTDEDVNSVYTREGAHALRERAGI